TTTTAGTAVEVGSVGGAAGDVSRKLERHGAAEAGIAIAIAGRIAIAVTGGRVAVAIAITIAGGAGTEQSTRERWTSHAYVIGTAVGVEVALALHARLTGGRQRGADIGLDHAHRPIGITHPVEAGLGRAR